jgi:hypothetical protein
MPYKDKSGPGRKATTERYRNKNREDLRAKGRERYLTRREEQYAYELGRHYGITLQEYKELLELQNNMCATCGGHNRNGTRLCVDHDHKTGRIRGLLCRRCNTLLGLCNDSKEILLSLIAYLGEN